jgi:hypothetical protein
VLLQGCAGVCAPVSSPPAHTSSTAAQWREEVELVSYLVAARHSSLTVRAVQVSGAPIHRSCGTWRRDLAVAAIGVFATL